MERHMSARRSLGFLALALFVSPEETDLIERPLAKIAEDGKILHLKLKPFEIKTIRAVRKTKEAQ